MKTFPTIFMLLLATLFAGACGSPNEPATTPSEQGSQAPLSIKLVFPYEDDQGCTIIVRGSGFRAAAHPILMVDSIQLGITSIHPTEITAVVPKSAATGTRRLVLWQGKDSASRYVYFWWLTLGGQYVDAVGTYPDSGNPGDTVTVYGYHFNNEAPEISARFGQTPARIIAISDGWLKIVVPPLAEDTLTVTGRTFKRAIPFVSIGPKPIPLFTSARLDIRGVMARIDRHATVEGSDLSHDTVESEFSVDLTLPYTKRIPGKGGVDTLIFSSSTPANADAQQTQRLTIAWDTGGRRIVELRYDYSSSWYSTGPLTSEKGLSYGSSNKRCTFRDIALTAQPDLLTGEVTGAEVPAHLAGYEYSDVSSSKDHPGAPRFTSEWLLLEVLQPKPDALMRVTLY